MKLIHAAALLFAIPAMAQSDHVTVLSIAPEVVVARPAGLGRVYVVRKDLSVVTCSNPEYGMWVRPEKANTPKGQQPIQPFLYVVPGDPEKGIPKTLYSNADLWYTVACLKVK